LSSIEDRGQTNRVRVGVVGLEFGVGVKVRVDLDLHSQKELWS